MTIVRLEHQPTVLCPFPPAISPYAGQVQQASTRWAEEFELVRSKRARSALNRLQYGSFMGRAYPTAALPALQLIADWNTWLFLLDDAFDEQELGRQPAQLAQLHARLLAIMRGGAPPDRSDTRYLALEDLTGRFRAQASGAWLSRFTRSVEATFAASVWEARNRVAGFVPTEAEYVQMRLFTSAVFCFLDFIEVAERMSLPGHLRYHPVVRALAVMTNNIISWFNDLISYPKEIARGDVHNLVYVVHKERGIALDRAVEYAARKHDAEVRAFQQSCLALPLSRRDRELRRYVAGLEAWIRANVDWSIDTARYRPIANRASPGRAGSELSLAHGEWF